ncbi:MAG: class I SAM-dependent methyltransferase [Methanosphaera stadtmanae]|jgi:ubiquinone/menaquinone biosynthesis C-methylase UbiE|nr:class I SAM-dependent methyltransferase [Methanosphaera stadtmanae]
MKTNSNDLTGQLLEKLNIKKNMRVLDIGCGTGGISIMLHNYIGNNGEIIGVDNDRKVIEAAKKNINQQNIEFINADINNLPSDIGEFDIIIGRRILMYQKDMSIIAKLKSILNKKGKIAFQEYDYNIPQNQRDYPSHLEFLNYHIESMKKESINTSMGSQLYKIFKDNELKIEYLNSQLSLEAQETESSLLWYFDSISSQLKKQKIIDDDYNLELLKENMENEIENSNYMFIKNMEYIIVGRKY